MRNVRRFSTIGVPVLLVVLLLYVVLDIVNDERIGWWAEGRFQLSPDKKWGVSIVSTSTSDPGESYCRISVFDTAKYPDLKKPHQLPSTMQEHNPTASYLLPVQYYARGTDFEWAPDSSYVVLKQGPVNDTPALSYKIHFGTFSLTKQDSDQ
jgi:hypothetical protein